MNEKQLADVIKTMPRFSRFKNIVASYVWGTTFGEHGEELKIGKVHAMFYGDNANGQQEFWSVCGIDDTPGNWRFAVEEWFDGKDGCKRCKKILEKAKR